MYVFVCACVHLWMGVRICLYVYQLSLISSEAAYAQERFLLCLGYATVRLIYASA